MRKKTDFDALEFTRKVRDAHAARLNGKSPQEILAFFKAASRDVVTSPKSVRRRRAVAA